MIFHGNVSSQRGAVGKDIVVADLAIVCDVNAYHEKIPRTNPRNLSLSTRPMEGAKLSYQIVVADFEVALFTLELNVLWFATNYGMFENTISRTQPGEAFDDGMSMNLAALTNKHIIFNDDERSDPNVVRDH